MAAESSYVYQDIQDTPTESAVYQEIEAMLLSYIHGIPVSYLESFYKKKFKRSLDYNSLDVKNIDELLGKMYDKGMVLFYDHAQTNEKFVTYARVPKKSPQIRDKQTELARFAEGLRKHLKYDVQKLLKRQQGKVPFSCFEDMYKERFERKLSYNIYNLTGLDHLCQVLNLVVVEESGQKVIKAGEIYNLRKRKIYG